MTSFKTNMADIQTVRYIYICGYNTHIRENIYLAKLCICVTYLVPNSLHFVYDLALNNEINTALESREPETEYPTFWILKISFNIYTN